MICEKGCSASLQPSLSNAANHIQHAGIVLAFEEELAIQLEPLVERISSSLQEPLYS